MALTAKKVYAILKRQISDMEAKLNSPVRYRGTVATADLLPLNPDIGDMYNIESKSVYGEAGMNVAWNGVVWDTMGAPIDMSLYIKSSELADWAKQPQKPDYTAEEVGALPANTKIPSKTSDLQNDSGFLTKIPDNYLSGTDKTLSASGKAADAKATGDKITELSADISNKLNKNQGSENSGKIAGINESGDIVPMFPVSVDYNEETNCLEFGSDQKMELNKGINLDSTLTKTGYAADAGAVGEITNSLKEDLDNFRFYESNGFFKFVSNWHNGDVNSAGEFVNSKSTRRSDKVEASLLKCVEIITHNHNGCSVREWDINGRYLGSSWVASSENIESRTDTFDFKNDTAYIAFTITGSTNYNANENNVDIKIFIDDYFLNDKSLQKALKIKKGFVSPVADFGAYGDGLHDDTEALQNCLKFCIENSVSLKCEKAYQFMITNTLELIGIDNSYTTGESENIVRTFKTINAEFDFNGSTILAYGNFAESSHIALYEGEEIPSVLYIKSTNLYDMHFEIKNLFIDARKINCVCVYADELKKSTFRNITIKHLAKIGIYIENNCGGIMFYDTQMIANKKKAIGFWNASSDCYFDGIYMVDVTYGMVLSASYSNIKKFHPFILTPSFILGSVMFKLLSRNASGKYVGESTIILDQCYADTYNVVFDVSSHIGHRIISTGMTYINNTQILNNLFGKDTPSKMVCVFTGENEGYANKVKLSSNYMSGYKKDDNVYTYLCDSAGDESIIDDMSVISNVNYNNGELIN